MFLLCVLYVKDKRQHYYTHLDAGRCSVGTWCTPGVQYAVENGYKVIEVYEVWH